MLELRNLSKSYKDQLVLDNINLTIKEDRIYGLLGVNGAGKTTLLKLMSDQLINYEGQILYNGNPITNNRNFKERVVYIGDGFVADAIKDQSIKKIVKWIKDLAPHFNEARFDTLIKDFKIDKKTKYHKLSTGNQNLLQNIIALCVNADLILLDEPANGLDEINRDLFYNKVLEYQAEDQSTVIISSHILSDLERVVSDILILKDNKILIDEEIENLADKAYKFSTSANNLRYFEGKKIISKSQVGNMLVLNVFDDFSAEELSQIEQIAKIQRLDLHELFINLNKEA